MKRRTFLKHSLVSGAGLSVGVPWSPQGPTMDRGILRASAGMDLKGMAREVLATSDIEKLALGWVDRGASYRDLLGAAYLSGIHEINPSPIGGQVHAMMMVPSALTVAGKLRGKQQLAPAIFNLQRVKRSQERDASNGDWQMPKAPAVAGLPSKETVEGFSSAMQEWDVAAADRATTAMHATLSQDEFFEQLWPWAARDFRIIGHKIIYATQTFRALQSLGWRHGRDGLRSVVLGILDKDPYGAFTEAQSDHILDVHERNVGRITKIPANWNSGEGDPKASFALLKGFRSTDSDAAAEIVLAALKRGVSGNAVWDGLRLYAFELVMQNPNIAGVHPVTTVNALYRASLLATLESSRRLMILQAASWMPMFHPILKERSGRTTRRIDGLKAGERSDPFDSPDVVEGGRRAFRLAQNDFRGFRSRAMEILARKAQHDHDYKFSVAAVEEMAAAHPDLRPYLAGASMAMMRTTKLPDNGAWRAAS